MTSNRSARPGQPRVVPVAEDSPLITERFADRPGSVLNVSRTIANNSGVFEPWSALARYLALDGILPSREREIVILRVGWRARSIYEFGQHTKFGRRAGLTEAEIAALAGEIRGGPWSEGEMALLQMVDELVDDDCVSDGTWERLSRRWSPSELVELVLLTGFTGWCRRASTRSASSWKKASRGGLAPSDAAESVLFTAVEFLGSDQ
jgi:4-carboxymuconolactone decarboxylase